MWCGNILNFLLSSIEVWNETISSFSHQLFLPFSFLSSCFLLLDGALFDYLFYIVTWQWRNDSNNQWNGAYYGGNGYGGGGGGGGGYGYAIPQNDPNVYAAAATYGASWYICMPCQPPPAINQGFIGTGLLILVVKKTGTKFDRI